MKKRHNRLQRINPSFPTRANSLDTNNSDNDASWQATDLFPKLRLVRVPKQRSNVKLKKKKNQNQWFNPSKCYQFIAILSQRNRKLGRLSNLLPLSQQLMDKRSNRKSSSPQRSNVSWIWQAVVRMLVNFNCMAQIVHACAYRLLLSRKFHHKWSPGGLNSRNIGIQLKSRRRNHLNWSKRIDLKIVCRLTKHSKVAFFVQLLDGKGWIWTCIESNALKN